MLRYYVNENRALKKEHGPLHGEVRVHLPSIFIKVNNAEQKAKDRKATRTAVVEIQIPIEIKCIKIMRMNGFQANFERNSL